MLACMQHAFFSTSLFCLLALSACSSAPLAPETPQAQTKLLHAKQACLSAYQTPQGLVPKRNMTNLMTCFAKVTQKYGPETYGAYEPIYEKGAAESVDAAKHLREGLFTPDQYKSEIELIREEEESAVMQKQAQTGLPAPPIVLPTPNKTSTP